MRAMIDWIVDNQCTPHIIVNAFAEGASVPQEFVKDGQIVLNVAPRAIQQFTMDNEGISFNARFGGVPRDVYAPMDSILGIVARENGKGMMFPPEESPPGGDDDPGAGKRNLTDKADSGERKDSASCLARIT